jgi:hypothetical protein
MMMMMMITMTSMMMYNVSVTRKFSTVFYIYPISVLLFFIVLIDKPTDYSKLDIILVFQNRKMVI